MTDLYPPESQNQDVVGHLEELRRRILICLFFLSLAFVFCFMKGAEIIRLAQAPSLGLIHEMIFISPTEVFVSYIKLSLLSAFIAVFPILLFEAWAFLSPAVSVKTKGHIMGWMALAVICFLAGILFSYYLAFPSAMQFLVNFGKGIAVANITLGKYVSFFVAFMLIGGCVFEIPVVMGLLTDIGLLKSSNLRSKRQYAVVIIMVIAAVITPTQDIVNMLIFALPMVLLFEVGIFVSALIERMKKTA